MEAKKTLKHLQRMYKGKHLKVVDNEWGTIVYQIKDVWAIGDEGAEYFEFIYESCKIKCIEGREYIEDDILPKLEKAVQKHLRYWLGDPGLFAGFTDTVTHEIWLQERKNYPFLMDSRILYGTEPE